MKAKNIILIIVFIGFISIFFICTILNPNVRENIFCKKIIDKKDNKAIISDIEKTFNENLILRNKIVSSYNYLQVNVLNTTLFSGFVRDNHKMIQAPVDYGTTSYSTNSTISLNKYCNSLGIPLLYINPLCKVIDGYSQLPYEIKDSSNNIADDFLNNIGHEVKYLDLRDNIENYKGDFNELFYKTDHHWTVPATFWAFSETISYLNTTEFKGKLDENNMFRNRENYYKNTLKDNYLGSQGNKLTSRVSGLDDFQMMFPKFKTDMELTQILKGKELHRRNGSFRESLIYEDLIKGEKDKFSLNSYASYLGYGNTEKRIINNLAENNYKALVIGDSFSRPFSSFMSLCFKETRNIDTQKGRFTGDVEKYIKEYKPDIVIMMFMNDATKDDEKGYNEKFDFKK